MTATAPRLTREQKARQMGRQGYTLSESVCTVGVFFIGRPDHAEPYIVDVAGGTCTCIDYARHGAPCKHQLFVSLCCRWWLTLEARPTRTVRNRRRFSARHLAAFRALAPTMAAPVEAVAVATTIGRAEMARRAAEDF